ncbi:MAG: 3-isopropylmalate dehydratase small subunit [Xanthobacteraceae bacterium]
MMQPFERLEVIAAPINTANMDTDQIIPARFCWRKRADGWGPLLFHDLRFDDGGSARPEFVLNREPYHLARILVADRNFGCGSSREQAVWSLYDYGIRAVIAPSFGDIFFNNSMQNGLLPVILAVARCDALRAQLEAQPGAQIAIDLAAQSVTAPDGMVDLFKIDEFRKECLLAGTDDISFTLRQRDAIAQFESAYDRKVSWL